MKETERERDNLSMIERGQIYSHTKSTLQSIEDLLSQT